MTRKFINGVDAIMTRLHRKQLDAVAKRDCERIRLLCKLSDRILNRYERVLDQLVSKERADNDGSGA